MEIFFKDNDSPWTDLDQGMKRKIIGHDDKIMMVKIYFPRGAVGYEHHHPHSQVSYVLNGRFEVTVDGKKQILQAGDSFFVPSEKTHGVVNLEEGYLIDVFSPKRSDFLE
jgi:unsaturated pyranuronate lyase